MWCASFYRSYDTINDLKGEELLMAPGECRLHPETVEVSGGHVCSKFSWERAYDDLTPVARWWLDGATENDKLRLLRAEIKRLKNANALLRKKLRDANVKLL
jgi:hypothetical protein